MKYSTQSNGKSNGNYRQHGARISQHQPGVRKAYKSPVIDARLFYDPIDGRKWKRRCEQKRAVWIALLDISHGSLKTCAVEKQIGRLKGIPPRTVRWIIRLLRTQVFLRDVRKHGLRDALERELLPDRLGKYPSPGSESCRASTRESCRVKAVRKLQLEPKADTADTAKTAALPVTPFKTTNNQEETSMSEMDSSTAANAPALRTNAQHIQHTAQSAFETAVRVFRSSTWFKIGEPYATGLAYWIASRSIRATSRHPRTVTYYTESAHNFFAQYREAQQDALMLEGCERYQNEIDQLHSRPTKKRPHRHLSAAEVRAQKTKEELDRVFGGNYLDIDDDLSDIHHGCFDPTSVRVFQNPSIPGSLE